MTLYGKMGEIQRKWDFYLNWRRTMVLTRKRDVSTGQLVSSYPITFTGTPAFDAFSEYNLLNRLSRYLKLCTTIIPLKWMEATMCFKLDTCLNMRQSEAHNPLTMIFSSCPWSLVSDNAHSHRAIPNTSPVLSVHSFQGTRPWIHGEDDCSMLEALASLSTFCWLCSRICCAQKNACLRGRIWN